MNQHPIIGRSRHPISRKTKPQIVASILEDLRAQLLKQPKRELANIQTRLVADSRQIVTGK